VSRCIVLDLVEREQIARGIDRKWTATAITTKLDRDQSVISREITQNGDRAPIPRSALRSGPIGCG
jgi:IS30 family transposase